ncbi:MAG: prolyl oligopeptidase family serine peptidase [Spirosomataceae bacterium]
MKKTIPSLLTLLLGVLLVSTSAFGQLAPLTVEKIMRDPKWIGVAPTNPFWSEDSKNIYFSWNPDNNKGDSLYVASVTDKKPTKVQPAVRRALPSAFGTYNRARTLKVFTRSGDLYLLDCKMLGVRQLTNTVENESNPQFSQDEQRIVFQRTNNLYSVNIQTGEVKQWTNFLAGPKRPETKPNEQEKWLKQDQLALFDVLRERADKRKEAEKINKADAPKRPKEIYLDDKQVDNVQLSPDENYVTYRLTKTSPAKNTIVPNYVTESGFTEDIPSRSKVGYNLASAETWVYDIRKDTSLQVSTRDLPGITDPTDYAKDYKKDTAKAKRPESRKLIMGNVYWSEDGKNSVIVARSFDNKDRWILAIDVATRKLKTLDRQRDEAWIGGPGMGFGFGGGSLGWINNQTFYYQSEADGYSHLYTVNVTTGEKKQLTKGKFEVQNVQLSKDKQSFYLTTNEVHPGEQHFYKMSVNGGERVKITNLTGSNQVTLSPDETQLAILYSYTNKPWELYVQENKPGATPVAITNSLTTEFTSYPWRDPQVITFKASDGADVYARLFVPKKKNGAAVVFVHGAGYLQNAHKWWSSYFREYMFHNLLTDKGYTVIDIDYRASAGYGRDWRTGIYRFMGGKDLTDHLDAAKYLTEKQGINPNRIGIYGGSYGGFITLMAMFTTPDVFKAGAALRPVTDWAAYNHGYTSNILNEPFTDSLAYHKSSPIYHANGLKGHLLICHGLVDVNVHIQDSFRLAQRLMELKKENWELAVYPVEDHGFVEPASWTDEYKRILKLFEEKLK